jgi:hypothetical protein
MQCLHRIPGNLLQRLDNLSLLLEQTSQSRKLVANISQFNQRSEIGATFNWLPRHQAGGILLSLNVSEFFERFGLSFGLRKWSVDENVAAAKKPYEFADILFEYSKDLKVFISCLIEERSDCMVYDQSSQIKCVSISRKLMAILSIVVTSAPDVCLTNVICSLLRSSRGKRNNVSW